MLRITICLCLGILFLSPTAAICDTLRLANGDTLTGQVVRMEEEVLVFASPYVAEELEFDWADIAAVTTEEPVRVGLEDGTTLHGRILEAETGRMKVKMGTIVETVSFGMDKVAAVNPRSPEEEDATTWKADVNVGMSARTGNTETEDVHADGKLVVRTDVHRYTVGAEYNQATQSDETTERNSLAYAKYDHFITDRWYLYANTLFEKDDIADLELRSTLGVGVGYQILDTKRAHFLIEAGPAYVNENFETGEDSETASGRWSVDFDYQLLQWMDLFHFQEGYLGLEDSDDLFVRTSSGLRFPITEGFHTTLQYDWDYNKSPAEGAEKIDRKYMFTLGYTFRSDE